MIDFNNLVERVKWLEKMLVFVKYGDIVQAEIQALGYEGEFGLAFEDGKPPASRIKDSE